MKNLLGDKKAPQGKSKKQKPEEKKGQDFVLSLLGEVASAVVESKGNSDGPEKSAQSSGKGDTPIGGSRLGSFLSGVAGLVDEHKELPNKETKRKKDEKKAKRETNRLGGLLSVVGNEVKSAAPGVIAGMITRKAKPAGDMEEKDIKGYEKHFSESKFAEKLINVLCIVGEQVIVPVLLLWGVLKADSTPMAQKATILGALGYFIVPLDLVPDTLGALGYTDDIANIGYVTDLVSKFITPEIELQAHNSYTKLTANLLKKNQESKNEVDSVDAPSSEGIEGSEIETSDTQA